MTSEKNVSDNKTLLEPNKKTLNTCLDSIDRTMQDQFTSWLQYDGSSFNEQKWNAGFDSALKSVVPHKGSKPEEVQVLNSVVTQLKEIQNKKVFEQLSQLETLLEKQSQDLKHSIAQQFITDKKRFWTPVLGEAEQAVEAGKSAIFGLSAGEKKLDSLEGIWQRTDYTDILGQAVNLHLQVDSNGKITHASPVPTDEDSLRRFWRAKFDFIKEKTGSDEVVLTINPQSRVFFGLDQFDMLLDLAKERGMMLYTSANKDPSFPGLLEMIGHLGEKDRKHIIDRFKGLLVEHQKREQDLASDTKQALMKKKEVEQETKDCEEKVDKHIKEIDSIVDAKADGKNSKFEVQHDRIDEAQDEIKGQMNKIEERMKDPDNKKSLQSRLEKLHELQGKIDAKLIELRDEMSRDEKVSSDKGVTMEELARSSGNVIARSLANVMDENKYDEKVNKPLESNESAALRKLETSHQNFDTQLKDLKQRLESVVDTKKEPSAPPALAEIESRSQRRPTGPK